MDKTIQVDLTRSERDLLLNIENLKPETVKKLQTTKLQGNTYQAQLTVDVLNTLIGGLEEESDRSDEAYLSKAYDELRRKLERTIQAVT